MGRLGGSPQMCALSPPPQPPPPHTLNFKKKEEKSLPFCSWEPGSCARCQAGAPGSELGPGTPRGLLPAGGGAGPALRGDPKSCSHQFREETFLEGGLELVKACPVAPARAARGESPSQRCHGKVGPGLWVLLEGVQGALRPVGGALSRPGARRALCGVFLPPPSWQEAPSFAAPQRVSKLRFHYLSKSSERSCPERSDGTRSRNRCLPGSGSHRRWPSGTEAAGGTGVQGVSLRIRSPPGTDPGPRGEMGGR